MISSPAVTNAVTNASIRSHDDRATPFDRLLWGPHIHHSLWDEETLAELASLFSIAYRSGAMQDGCCIAHRQPQANTAAAVLCSLSIPRESCTDV